MSSCVSVGQSAKYCGPNDHPTYFTEEQIDHMDDQQIKDQLAKNEALVAKGCAVPNKD
ncbi:hypothetical protein HOS22_gp18 [Rhizobium phage RHEph08]|uniref:Uncharacterized protein n=5 Tax=Cuernavacavirus TaxID=2731935 RepID=A0A7S5RA96_9CAUD|nr:hypothetical protein HOS21_gp18 [Rhizobium phage RHEph02]YP_009793201.1 hypothetical protein HOS22_gp18 [Rhizobium phage RHEph08]YP_009793256.1 hypothetical protein HOS23_gp14 [Rhizobium phage RHEph09]AGC35646.1 hypothetical protein RHEph03_gp019 [Rhizobium phage RHEph03]QIG68414.1 hypothetical protein EVB62_012 [Rhizobium phage RHph_TM33]AGC35585.1 hypothetical protein RHEph02_gp018 [Rhizobium phage RHEph02]AGC35942.1 hypothetical protein RHEph08_gp018 [Rhizobium phage RHEph08]AGC35997.1